MTPTESRAREWLAELEPECLYKRSKSAVMQKSLEIITDLLAENEKYRTALERIADLPHLAAPLSWGIAREALGGQK